ncbi:helix-turn-helix domain-containing protein [Clostridium sp. 'White wine YQ']|uniref:helix-turn-helix domain-containing protein n=1 Tax=Clostridium sp. 'White wine YQ' TaxID=3027474 RepID=UPI002366C191|nr:helix-turn-helix transcriptional regulator [Clostridium sp. 'White wine YQ']MDD7794834.1 helix-turn-helix transcriptional regulator [Clostridium sp. 'White wine YQ']
MDMNEKIKLRREELGLTLQEVGEYLGVSKATVQRYESGEIKNLKLDSIEKLAEILKVSPTYLMGWEEQRKPNKLETLAAHFDGDDFTKDDLDDIENFIKYIKSKKKQ